MKTDEHGLVECTDCLNKMPVFVAMINRGRCRQCCADKHGVPLRREREFEPRREP